MAGMRNVSVEGKSFSNEDTFYRALIKGKYTKDGTKVTPRAFADIRASVDWSAYAEPADTAKRLNTKDPNHLPIRVASITAQSIWESLRYLLHDPLQDNYAHCLIVDETPSPIGTKDEARVKLARAATIVYTHHM